MVKTKYTAAEIKKIVQALAKALIMNNVSIDKIILYGSYAKGTQRDHSDIDLAVISPSFRGKKLIEIQADLALILSHFLAVVEPVGYSTDEYISAEAGSLLGEIKRSGKVLWERAA